MILVKFIEVDKPVSVFSEETIGYNLHGYPTYLAIDYSGVPYLLTYDCGKDGFYRLVHMHLPGSIKANPDDYEKFFLITSEFHEPV